jgi:hypothetical protein
MWRFLWFDLLRVRGRRCGNRRERKIREFDERKQDRREKICHNVIGALFKAAPC